MGICNEKPTIRNLEQYKSLLSTDEFRQIPIVTLEEAVKPLISYSPTIESYVQMVKQKCLNPADGLTPDESASIMLYSMTWQPSNQCIYTLLNSTLQALDETKLHPWFLYLKLLFTALLQLPSNDFTVYRGSTSNLSKQYKIDNTIVWWDLSLCTTSIERLGKTGIRTLFTIQCNTAKDIQDHCYCQSDNFVLFLPATKFQVIECFHEDNDDLYMVTLQEIDSSFLIHSLDDVRSNLNMELSSNMFKRIWSSIKRSSTQSLISNNHYRNTSLEHRIVENGHSWTIDLDRQNLIDQDMKIVVKYAINKNRCKRIRLRDNYIASEGSSILAEGLLNNTTLESLDLRNNPIRDLGVQVLSLSIIHSNIKTLNLESNDITAEGAQYLAQLIQESRTLTELYLSKNHLGDLGVELIANALNDNDVGAQGQSDKAIFSTRQSSLQHLYLGQNDITDEGVKHLSDMLKTNRTLTWLWLTGNEISHQGVELLSHILANYNITLEWLFLNSNKLITDSSIDDLLHMLKRNNTLKTLYLNNCNLSEITKRKLLQMTKIKKDFDLEV